MSTKNSKKKTTKSNKTVNKQIISQEETVNILKGLSVKVDVANAQILNLGLLVEYLYEKLEQNTVDLEVDKFPEWAEARHKEIQDQAESMMKEGLIDDLKGELEKAAGISFDENAEGMKGLEGLGELDAALEEKIIQEMSKQQR